MFSGWCINDFSRMEIHERMYPSTVHRSVLIFPVYSSESGEEGAGMHLRFFFSRLVTTLGILHGCAKMARGCRVSRKYQ